MNTTKKRNVMLIISLFWILIALVTSIGLTLAWQTSTGHIGGDFTMGEVKSELTFEGETVNESPYSFTIDNLVYLDLEKDCKKEIVNSLAVKKRVTIKNTGDVQSGAITVHDLIHITNDLPVFYIVYIDLLTELDAVEDTYYDTLQKIISTATTREEIRSNVDSYNTLLFKTLYENYEFSTTSDAITIEIVLWGDYEALSLEQKANYENLEFNFTISHDAIQCHPDEGELVYE